MSMRNWRRISLDAQIYINLSKDVLKQDYGPRASCGPLKPPSSPQNGQLVPPHGSSALLGCLEMTQEFMPGKTAERSRLGAGGVEMRGEGKWGMMELLEPGHVLA